MLVRNFICATHQEFGGLGWRPAWQPSFDPLPGMTVAHDILEHFADDRGTMADEFQALGACVHIRGLSYWFAQQFGNTDPAANIAADLPDIFMRGHDGGESLSWPGPTRELADEEAENIIQDAVRMGLDEFRTMCWDPDIPSPDADWVVGWMRIGFRRALRRYRRRCRYDLAQVFDQISADADRLLKAAIEGDRLKVSVNLRRGYANLDVMAPYDEYA